jgi:hypothetical protein
MTYQALCSVGPYKISKNSFFRWIHNDIISAEILVALKSNSITASKLAEQLNDQLGRKNIIYFSQHDNKLAINYDGNLKLASVQDAIYETIGFTQWVEPAELISNPIDNIHFTDAHNLLTVIDGTGNLGIDNLIQVISFKSIQNKNATTVDIVDCINSQLKNLPGGFKVSIKEQCVVISTLHKGINATIAIKSISTARSLLGFKSIAYGFSKNLM